MDIIDSGDYDFLLPRRLRQLVAVALTIGIAFVPPVKRWYLDQIERHAQHITEELVSIVTPNDAKPGKSEPAGGRAVQP